MVDSTKRISPGLYRNVRTYLRRNDPDGENMYRWANELGTRPVSPEKLAQEVIWIILCAGRSAQAARTIERKVLAAIEANRPVVEAFGYKAKAAAIERAWQDRESDFEALSRIDNDDLEGLLDWCQSIPFIGDDTKYQLAKNVGSDVAKPDIWLCRLAGIPDKPRIPVKERFRRCQAMCEHLSQETGDCVKAIDTMLWLACNKGILHVSNEAGPITLVPAASKKRAIT